MHPSVCESGSVLIVLFSALQEEVHHHHHQLEDDSHSPGADVLKDPDTAFWDVDSDFLSAGLRDDIELSLQVFVLMAAVCCSRCRFVSRLGSRPVYGELGRGGG
jgi:hypothetical protein